MYPVVLYNDGRLLKISIDLIPFEEAVQLDNLICQEPGVCDVFAGSRRHIHLRRDACPQAYRQLEQLKDDDPLPESARIHDYLIHWYGKISRGRDLVPFGQWCGEVEMDSGEKRWFKLLNNATEISLYATSGGTVSQFSYPAIETTTKRCTERICDIVFDGNYIHLERDLCHSHDHAAAAQVSTVTAPRASPRASTRSGDVQWCGEVDGSFLLAMVRGGENVLYKVGRLTPMSNAVVLARPDDRTFRRIGECESDTCRLEIDSRVHNFTASACEDNEFVRHFKWIFYPTRRFVTLAEREPTDFVIEGLFRVSLNGKFAVVNAHLLSGTPQIHLIVDGEDYDVTTA